MNHGGVHFDTGWKTVNDDAAGFLFKDLEKVSSFGEFLVSPMNGGGELAFKS